MKIASVCCVYNEAHYLPRHLKHMPIWVDEQLVTVSEKPWYGDELLDDGSAKLASDMGATVLRYPWKDEVEQRNAGQDYLSDYDWILNLEPDEFLDNDNWERLHQFILGNPELPAYVTKQRIFWGKGFESDPPEDFSPIILTRPSVKFIEKRNVNSAWEWIPNLTLLHFAWARTDEEIWKKISHYSHAIDFNIDDWYHNVWLARKTENVHPLTPESIPKLIPAVLPPEIAELDIWPK